MKKVRGVKKRWLRPPPESAPETVRALWFGSGPGRAWKYFLWAKSIKLSDPRRPLAEDVCRRVAEIMGLYRKGAASRASVLLERLRTVIAATELRRHRKPKGAVRESTRILVALRQQYPEPAKQFWKRLERDERFVQLDETTIMCKTDSRRLTLDGLPTLLSKLSKLSLD